MQIEPNCINNILGLQLSSCWLMGEVDELTENGVQ